MDDKKVLDSTIAWNNQILVCGQKPKPNKYLHVGLITVILFTKQTEYTLVHYQLRVLQPAVLLDICFYSNKQ